MTKALTNLKNGITDAMPATRWTYQKAATVPPAPSFSNKSTDQQAKRMAAVTKKQKTYGVPGAK